MREFRRATMPPNTVSDIPAWNQNCREAAGGSDFVSKRDL